MNVCVGRVIRALEKEQINYHLFVYFHAVNTDICASMTVINQLRGK